MPAGKDIPSSSDEAAKEGLIRSVSSLNENKNGTFQPFVEAGTCRYHVVKCILALLSLAWMSQIVRAEGGRRYLDEALGIL